jgi:hypothetical protein
VVSVGSEIPKREISPGILYTSVHKPLNVKHDFGMSLSLLVGQKEKDMNSSKTIYCKKPSIPWK